MHSIVGIIQVLVLLLVLRGWSLRRLRQVRVLRCWLFLVHKLQVNTIGKVLVGVCYHNLPHISGRGELGVGLVSALLHINLALARILQSLLLQ